MAKLSVQSTKLRKQSKMINKRQKTKQWIKDKQNDIYVQEAKNLDTDQEQHLNSLPYKRNTR